MTIRRPLGLLICFVTACAAPAPPPGPVALADLPNINTDAVLADIKSLSADAMEGRAPGTPGETLAVDYITGQFRAAGLEPGNPDGTWVQKVPLAGIAPSEFSPLVVKKGTQTLSLNHDADVVAFSQRVTDTISLKDADLIFTGYGVQAPEYTWDDFKGVDVKGKTIIVLVNDPPVPDAADAAKLDAKIFGGTAMTYYGRWTYKYEKAAELGAAGVFIVHETIPAGYDFGVVQGFGGERFDLITPDKNLGRAAVQGWLSLDAATRLFKFAGQDYQALKARARSRDFTPVPLKLTASMSFKQTVRTIDSQNVVARLSGSDPALKNEYVVYDAHWDHLGRGNPVNGDDIYNGALDNASGVAMLIEIARQFKKMRPAPKRTIVFLAVTAEEQGLLGSAYYTRFPLYPLEKTLANINMDEVNVRGRTSDITIIGLGASDLDDYVRDAAREQGRTVTPDAEPEKGFYYRSDHFNFAKAGVPALDPKMGDVFVGKPPSYGKERRDEWNKNDYHKPSDVVKPWWDLGGAADDGKLFLAVGYRIAQADRYPEWKPGNEFKSIRDKMLSGATGRK
jgi:Zn-dependent M28 family amino/carboxypeptidase